MKNKYIKIFLIWMIAMVLPMPFSAKDFTVVIDAGHGGKDAGSADNGIKEKDVNLAVALRLAETIKKKNKNIKVVLTRNDDTYLTLQQRADKANSSKGDIFVSIHCNSVDLKNPKRKTVHGASSHVLGLHKDDNNMAVARRENSVIKLESDYKQKYSGFDPNADESYIIFEMAQKKNLSNSIRLANKIQNHLKSEAGRKDNGVHQNGFWVLWATSMPAALIELDFICNPESADFMGSKAGQSKFAEAIYEAINEYYKEQKKTLSANKEDVVLPDNAENDNGNRQLALNTTEIIAPERIPRTQRRPESRTTYFASTGKRRRRSESARLKSIARDVSIKEIYVKPASAFDFKSEESESYPEKDSPGVKTQTSQGQQTKSTLPTTKKSSKNKGKASKKTKMVLGKSVEIADGKTIRVSDKSAGTKIETASADNVSAEHNKREKKASGKKSAGKKAHLNHKYYYVQLIVCEKQLQPTDPRLSDLPEIKCVKNGDNYTYLCRGGESIEDARLVLSKAKNNFANATIVSAVN